MPMIDTTRAGHTAAALATISFIPCNAQVPAWLEVACLTERFLAQILSLVFSLDVCALFISALDFLPKANRTSLA
ncbi:MAG: hypothetical protein WCA36_02450 [Pseudolabrys sp.]